MSASLDDISRKLWYTSKKWQQINVIIFMKYFYNNFLIAFWFWLHSISWYRVFQNDIAQHHILWYIEISLIFYLHSDSVPTLNELERVH